MIVVDLGAGFYCENFQYWQYAAVTWVWAAMLTVMTTVHRQSWERSKLDEPKDSQMVSSFQAILQQAAAAEMSAA